MTIVLKAAVGEEGLARILQINLPTELSAGEPVLGSIVITNAGAVEDMLRILVTTEWNSKQYVGSASVPVGSTYKVNIASSAGIVMPAEDAKITIQAQHDEAGTWVTDETATH